MHNLNLKEPIHQFFQNCFKRSRCDPTCQSRRVSRCQSQGWEGGSEVWYPCDTPRWRGCMPASGITDTCRAEERKGTGEEGKKKERREREEEKREGNGKEKGNKTKGEKKKGEGETGGGRWSVRTFYGKLTTQWKSVQHSFKTNMLQTELTSFQCNYPYPLTLTYSVGMICFALLWCRITLYTVSGTKSNTRFKYTSSFCRIRTQCCFW